MKKVKRGRMKRGRTKRLKRGRTKLTNWHNRKKYAKLVLKTTLAYLFWGRKPSFKRICNHGTRIPTLYSGVCLDDCSTLIWCDPDTPRPDTPRPDTPRTRYTPFVGKKTILVLIHGRTFDQVCRELDWVYRISSR